MTNGINAHSKPEFEGQIVKFKSPHANVVLYDIAKRNLKYGYLEWWAINDPSDYQIKNAMWAE
jgi:dTDP-4-dehydrorhamnose 3,5-epimerase-like enzyme